MTLPKNTLMDQHRKITNDISFESPVNDFITQWKIKKYNENFEKRFYKFLKERWFDDIHEPNTAKERKDERRYKDIILKYMMKENQKYKTMGKRFWNRIQKHGRHI
jgi:hypothetical protein